MIFLRMPYVDVEARRAFQRKRYRERLKFERNRSRQRYWTNREAESDRKRKFYSKNKTTILAKCKTYADKNREKRRNYARRYFQANKQRVYEYRKANPWIHRAALTQRRARIAQAPTLHSDQVARWEKKWRQSRWVRCYWCDKSVPGKKAHLDHIIPLSRGGSHSPDNVCISCSNCNRSKNARSITQFNNQLQIPKLQI